MSVIIVTGAGRGLGAAIVAALQDRGATVVAASRAVCDVADMTQVRGLIERVRRDHGRIDAVVSNAGVIEPIGLIGDTDPAEWSRNIAVNLVGPYHVMHAALPVMLAQGGGTIVNISTGAAARPLEGWSAYCSAKAGLAMLTQALHLEYAARGIAAYGFRPGMMDTGMQEKIRASGLNELSRKPQADLPGVERPAAIAAWLAMLAPFDLAGHELAVSDSGLYERAAQALAAHRK